MKAFLLAIALLLVPSQVLGGDLFLPAGAATTNSNDDGCTRMQVNIDSGTVIWLECEETGDQYAFWWVPVPPDFDGTFDNVVLTWHTPSPDVNSAVCWEFRMSVIEADATGIDFTSATISSKVMLLTDATILDGSNNQQQTIVGTNYIPSRRGTGGETVCSTGNGTTCNSLYAVVQLQRNNVCAGNLNASAMLDQIRLQY